MVLKGDMSKITGYFYKTKDILLNFRLQQLMDRFLTFENEQL